MSLIDDLKALQDEASREVEAAASAAELEALRVKYLGKKGSLAAALRGMGQVPASERPAIGQAANDARDAVERLLSEATGRVEQAALTAELARTPLDVTLPGRRTVHGRRHPLTRTLEEIVACFRRLGFGVLEGPQIELDFYNFEALNFPKDHPARDMQDTFFVDSATLGAAAGRSDVLLRTHTSPVQIRSMLSRKPPIRLIMPGTVFRCDSDPTHSPMFHQVEGLYVDRGVSFADLKGTLDAYVKAMFGDRKTRFRPSFFPFVEPGAEMDMSCGVCGGSATLSNGDACRTCKGTGWVEVMGAGMVHPNVLRACGIDPEEFTGFAFGFGVERIAMMRYGIDDLRHLFENDVRFLEQF
jgi:phenylalanyl-tRNA synthetase alpha chain